MSDDTPTERFRPGDDRDPARQDGGAGDPEGAAADDAPTERFDAGAAARDDTPTELFRSSEGADDGGYGDAPTRRLPQQTGDGPVAAHVPVYDGREDPLVRRDAPTAAAPAAARPGAAGAAGSGRGGPPPKRSNGPMIALIVVGTLVVVGLVVLALVLTTQNDDTATEPSASPSPTATEDPTPTPSETETEEPTPTPTETAPPVAEFVSFSPTDGTAISCPDEETEAPLVFSWSTTGAERAWIDAGTTDARAQGEEVDPSGTYRDLVFDCAGESEVYTVTAENADGETTSESVTLVRELDAAE